MTDESDDGYIRLSLDSQRAEILADADDLRLCDDATTLDRLVCWPEDPRIVPAMTNLLGECGIDCRTETDTAKVFVSASDQVAANAAFRGLIYGLVERDTDVARLLDIIRRLRDFAPPATHARDRDAKQVLRKKGGAE